MAARCVPEVILGARHQPDWQRAQFRRARTTGAPARGASASAVLGVTLAIRIVVIVFCSPWAGQIAERFGARAVMIGSDLVQAGVVAGFFFATSVWQIYALAVALNLGAALFTPVYKAVIPGVVSEKQYPRALAFGAIAYDIAGVSRHTRCQCEALEEAAGA